jgi:hypothetical protein
MWAGGTAGKVESRSLEGVTKFGLEPKCDTFDVVSNGAGVFGLLLMPWPCLTSQVKTPRSLMVWAESLSKVL